MGILGDKTKREFLSAVDRVNLGLEGLHREAGYVGTKTKSAADGIKKSGDSANAAREKINNLANAYRNLGNRADTAKGKMDEARKAAEKANNARGTGASGWEGMGEFGLGKYYADGGIIDYTGPAMVHGTPSEPEFVFNHPQFKALAQYIAEARSKITVPVPKIGPSLGEYMAKAQASMPKMAPMASLLDKAKQALNIGSFITIQGDITPEAVPRVEEITNDGIKQLREVLQVGIR